MWSSLLGNGSKKKQKDLPGARSSGAASTGSEIVGPPLTPEETSGNLSLLERQLNTAMVCPAGKNQVFIRSLVTKHGTTPPRIALKCTYRRDLKQQPEVFYEHIRDVCCSDPGKCPAYQAFQKRLGNL